jgi:hypothetical protein
MNHHVRLRALSLALLAGCAGANLEQLKGTAASALECHEARITFRKVHEQIYFASGCEREASFVERCDDAVYRTHCRWELQTTVYPAGTAQRERDLAEERRHGNAPDPARPMPTP